MSRIGISVRVCQRCQAPHVTTAQPPGEVLLTVSIGDFHRDVCHKCVDDIQAQFKPLDARLEQKIKNAVDDVVKQILRDGKP